MFHNKNRWPLVGLCTCIALCVGTLYAMVFFSAYCGYPIVAAMLVVIGLIIAIYLLLLNSWSKIKKLFDYVPSGIGIAATLISVSNVFQDFLKHPGVFVGIVIAIVCLTLSYNTFYERKS